jgi:anti-sigma regulatory factor (Ser/Thr protein kinase)
VELQGVTAQCRQWLDEPTQIGEARRMAVALAQAQGLPETAAGSVALVATELANNVLRHGGGGELLLQAIVAGRSKSIEVLAIDRGPGMENIEHCMKDGYSTGGTPGTGLGAVRRVATEFDIHSVPGEGTVVVARVGAKPAIRFGAVSVPLRTEMECGDCWRLATQGNEIAVMVADGLGHGTFAAQAAQAAATAFAAAPFGPPEGILERAHRAMSGTRGAAAACAHLDDSGAIAYAGVGNISATLASTDKTQGLVSHNGTLGLRAPKVQGFAYRRAEPALLVMHSDGISARWTRKSFRALMGHHPAIVAGVLYRDHAREHDDATIVVLN